MNRAQSGYIFIVTLIILASLSFLVTRIALQSDTFVDYARVAVDQVKARELAIAGIHVGMSQLADGMMTEQGKEKQPSITTEQQLAQRLLRTIVPRCGKLQTYALKKNKDGVDGTIAICITCEEGKLNLNTIYDMRAKKFVGEEKKEGNYKTNAQYIFDRAATLMQGSNLFTTYVDLMQERSTVINDATELLTQPSYNIFANAIFYDPQNTSEDGNQSKHPLYLEDLFTTWPHTRMLEPWLLSDSICAVLGLKRTVKKDKENVPQELPTTFVWDKDWDTYLAPLYGKKYMELPEFIRSILATKFEPRLFSVLSYGKIGRVTQKMLAIVELRVVTTQKKQKRYDANIRAVYWL